MTDSVSKEVKSGDIPVLAKAARLDLAPDRLDIVAPALDSVLHLFDALDSVDLGETPPTNSFDPRWRDRS